MPIYEYVCMSCESHFEELVRNDETPACPDCGAAKVQRQFSVFARSRHQHAAELRRRAQRGSGAVVAAAVGTEAVAAATDRSEPDLTPRRYGDAVAGCTRCALAATRTQVVFGSGSPTADLMFVGEAPGFHEDKQGVPFVGAAGQLLGKLLAGIGLDARRRLHRERAQVPPARQPRPAAGGDRGLRGPPLPADRADPAEGRRDARQLRDQAALRQAASGSRGCTGRSRRSSLGGSRVLLYPLFHPAAALYTPRMLDVLETDFRRLPELLGRTAARAGRARAARAARGPIAAPRTGRASRFSSASSEQGSRRARHYAPERGGRDATRRRRRRRSAARLARGAPRRRRRRGGR